MFVVCQKGLEIIKHMNIDHEGKHSLSSFRSKKKTGKVTLSDHYPVILTLDLSIPIVAQVRSSQYNFKDSEGQMLFHHMTDNSTKLTQAISTGGTFKDKVSKWEKQLKSFFFQAFPKIRHRKRKFNEDEVGFLLEKRKRLKLNPVSPDNDRFIEEVEELIVSKTEHKYAEIVKETLGGITGEDGKINANGLWKQTRKIFPKHKDPIPMALEDNNGNIITNYNLIQKKLPLMK